MTPPETSSQPPADIDRDEPGNWYPHNWARIDEQLQALAPPDPSGVKPQPAAVFDFDNTCIFHDIGQATFLYQLLRLRYRITPDQLAALLPRDDERLPTGIPAAAVHAPLIDSYRRLWPAIAADRPDEVLDLPAHRLFSTLLLWFVQQARQAPELGPEYVLPFMAKLLAGFTTSEVEHLAVEVIDAAKQGPLTPIQLTVDAPPPIGPIAVQYPRGLHPYPEMRTLMQRLAAHGVACFVISASTEWLVTGAVRRLDFPVEHERIFGIRVRLDGKHLTTEAPVAYPTTFRAGKVEVIHQHIRTTPFLVAGDADTDYEMLTLPGVRLRLLINRQQSGMISSLYHRPDILLQGVDLATGRFVPSRESTGC
ncbi:MAG: haloacid dehalogenase-like hydrolase [Desulfobulbus sp.]|jgi:phosphoserine phosphatase